LEELQRYAEELDAPTTVSLFQNARSLEAQGMTRAALHNALLAMGPLPLPASVLRALDRHSPAALDLQLADVTARLAALRPLDGELALALDPAPPQTEVNTQLATLREYLASARGWRGWWAFGPKRRARAVLTRYGLTLAPETAERVKSLLEGVSARRYLEEQHRLLLGDQATTALPRVRGLASDEAVREALASLVAAANAMKAAVADDLVTLTRTALGDASSASALRANLEHSPRRQAQLARFEATIASCELFAKSWVVRHTERARHGLPVAPTFAALIAQLTHYEHALRIEDALRRLPAELAAPARALVDAAIAPNLAQAWLQRAVLEGELRQRLKATCLARIDAVLIERRIQRSNELYLARQSLAARAIQDRWLRRQRERVLASSSGRLNKEGAALRGRLFVRGSKALRLRQVIHQGRTIEGGDPLFDCCPVWMASPETVAQVLPLEPIFDLAVFDEASQLRIEEALPVLVRARRVVIAGDPRQLPPTRFFETTIAQDAELDEDAGAQQLFEQHQREVEDLLAASLNLAVDQCYLDVHYRSRHAALIEFSNQHFYSGRLQALPGHPTRKTQLPPITLVPVAAGCYSERCNEIEAEEVARQVDTLLDSPAGTEPPSLGVACFNLPQREAILEALERRAAASAEFAARLDRARERRGSDSFEGLFVKNLENVQGDERDVIVISTTYGPDASGRFHRRFGPLGQVGGGRRLNVLVTRARQRVLLVTSIPRAVYAQAEAIPPQMDPGGGWLLMAYLRYAEAMARANALEQTQTDRSHDRIRFDRIEPTSSVAMALAPRLQAEDRLVTAHWGNPGFCVDIVLERESNTAAATAAHGVLVDFPRYPSAPDPVRWELFRSEILQSLGWRIERCWSPLVVRDLEAQVARLQRLLG
jgi:HAMP domain-containing protein